MKAIALAAGLGTRLGGLTAETPKCMIEVAGKSILLRNLEWARDHGVTEVAVNLHYRPDRVKGHFEAHGSPLPIRWSFEPELLGTAGTIASLRRWIGDERFAVIYADNLIGCGLEPLLAQHERIDATATVALFHREDVTHSGVAEVDDDGRIVSFVEKPAPGETTSHWVSAGLLVLEPQVADLAPERGDIGRDLLPGLLEAGATVAGYRMSATETLHWIDTPADLERTTRAFAEAAA